MKYEFSTVIKGWNVYIMSAPFVDGAVFFKVGISQNIAKRVAQVQTGCPLRITEAWAINVLDNGHAQGIEAYMHSLLRSHHSHGEWFRFDINDADHKRAINEAMRKGAEMATGKEGAKWRHLSIPQLKQACRELAEEMAATERRRMKEMRNKALVQMATQGRQIL